MFAIYLLNHFCIVIYGTPGPVTYPGHIKTLTKSSKGST